MAIKSDPEVHTPESTGAVEFDGTPTTVEQEVDNTSTDAVKYEAPGETTVDYHGADAVVREATPSEPVTMTVSWKSDAEAKVVTTDGESSAPKKSAKAKTK